MRRLHLLTFALIASTPLWIGCGTNVATKQKPAVANDHDHDHDHDHGHAEKKSTGDAHKHDEHGPHGGHIAHFDTNTSTHFEWAHDDDTQTLTVYFEELVSGGTKVDSVEVVVTSSGSEKKFKLEPVDSAKIAGSIYQIKDQELLTLVGASGDDEKGVQARLVATIAGKQETVLLKDEHHHH